MRARTSITLALAMLSIIAAVFIYTLDLLSQEKRLLTEQRHQAQTKALALLSAQIEHVLMERVEQTFALLFSHAHNPHPDAGYTALRSTVPSISQLIFFDPKLTTAISVPTATRGEKNWLIMRLAAEKLGLSGENGIAIGNTPQTFVEKIDGGFALFAFQREQAATLPSRWVVIRFDLNALLQESVTPMIAELATSLNAEIELSDPDTWNADDDDGPNFVEWPIHHVLSGWMLGLAPHQVNEGGWMPREGAGVIGVAIAVVLTLMLAGYFIWRELVQEHALVELRKQFVANVTHELKTPLALIRMYAETLYLERIKEPERAHQYLHVILREAERLTDMITRVLDFSSLSQNAHVYHLNDRNLVETVSAVLETYSDKVQEAGLVLHTEIADDIPPVPHDRHGIMQVLINLLDNAAKYGASGGTVTVRLSADANGVSLSAIDSGPGIPKADVERLRQPYERGQMIGSSVGTGLGLALVEQIVRVHHGKLDITSASAKGGLCVTVRFPLNAAAATKS